LSGPAVLYRLSRPSASGLDPKAVHPSGSSTKLIGNDVSGFDDLIADQGDETKLPMPFDPDA
jgi:hypothetical protein